MKLPPSDLAAIRASHLFDADWYTTRYRDVVLTGMSPAAHFLRFGRTMRRSPGPRFDTGFVLDRYADIRDADRNPLVAYLDCTDTDRRPTTAEELDGWLCRLRDGLSSDKGLLLWVQVRHMDPRLAHTIKSAASACEHHGAAHLLIDDSDADPAAKDWLTDQFEPAMQRRIIQRTSRTSSVVPGRRLVMILQPGQSVSQPELAYLDLLLAENPTGFLMHRLLGRWDSPASHKVIMPDWLFRDSTTDRRCLPWARDGMDRLLSALRLAPALPLLREREDPGIFDQCPYYRDLLQANPLANVVIEVARGPALPEITPTEEPVERDGLAFNAALTAMTHLSDPAAKQEMLHRLNRHKMQVIEKLSPDRVLDDLFAKVAAPLPDPVDAEHISLFACVRDESALLNVLIPHYRSIGVTRFFIVDDGSRQPVRDMRLGPDVAVFSPACGDFRTSKTLWIESLMKVFLQPGAWVLTVDADEFIRLPREMTSLPELARHLDGIGRDFAAGLLLDMLPVPGSAIDPARNDPRDGFVRFLYDPSKPPDDYRSDPAVRWGFGAERAHLSWRFDARWRLFGTVDSLRKMPFFRYWPDRHPNQGFHSFDYLDTARIPGPGIWAQTPVLPMLHYKLVKLFDDDSRRRMLERSAGYHAQTSANIAQSFAMSDTEVGARLLELRPWLRDASEADIVTRDFARAAGPICLK
ncbi:glycosyltransferase family 2 protein [Paracoccus beibuensis]|uniref:glycosyltransferase family 2 protein n=1 Tax=Paracoccus beibuensis TaxID=547602 RepID=UPI0022409A89|nr:glycosyltransferase family 2 protein [Paracoccus beibuensis]